MPYAAITLSEFKKSIGASKENRPNSYQRGYGGKKWDKFRRDVFLRDNYICHDCGKVVIDKHKEPSKRPHCDHISAHKGNKELMWSMLNAQTLCGSCHSKKTVNERGGLYNG